MKKEKYLPTKAQSSRVWSILVWVAEKYEGMLPEDDIEAINRVLYQLEPEREDYESDPLTDGGGPGSWEAGRVDYTGERGEPALVGGK